MSSRPNIRPICNLQRAHFQSLIIFLFNWSLKKKSSLIDHYFFSRCGNPYCCQFVHSELRQNWWCENGKWRKTTLMKLPRKMIDTNSIFSFSYLKNEIVGKWYPRYPLLIKCPSIENRIESKSFFPFSITGVSSPSPILFSFQEYSVQITFRQQWNDDRLSYESRLTHGDMRGTLRKWKRGRNWKCLYFTTNSLYERTKHN